MAGGRPTEYNDEILKKAKEYIVSCKDSKKAVRLPKAEGLALYLGVTRKTLYNWADEHEEFLHMLEEINNNQVEKLIDNGLSGKYNSTIAKLVLAKHGYKDQVGLSGEGEGEAIKIDSNVAGAIGKIYGSGKPGPDSV